MSKFKLVENESSVWVTFYVKLTQEALAKLEGLRNQIVEDMAKSGFRETARNYSLDCFVSEIIDKYIESH